MTIKSSSENLFILAEFEHWGKTEYSAPGEGEQYAYYKAGNAKAGNAQARIVYPDVMIWTRSPDATSSTSFTVYWGSIHYMKDAKSKNYVLFAFCI